MELLELKATIRIKDNSPGKALRRQGKLPAVLYGPKIEPVLLALDTNDIELALKKGEVGLLFFNLVVQNGDTYNKSVMIKELQTHFIGRSDVRYILQWLWSDR